MRRLLATIGCDVRVQLRAGFYYAAVVVILFWAVARAAVPGLGQGWLVPAMVLNALAITAFYFVGGLVLIERGQGTLRALAVTPLRPDEYLVARLATLGGLALVQGVAAALILVGTRFGVLALAVGTLLCAALLTLVGLVAVTRAASFNTYLIPSVGYLALLLLPLAPYVSRWDGWPLYLHPMQPGLVLMRAAFEPTSWGQLALALVSGAAWLAAAYWLARRALLRELVQS